MRMEDPANMRLRCGASASTGMCAALRAARGRLLLARPASVWCRAAAFRRAKRGPNFL
jgi:hypothetical protein